MRKKKKKNPAGARAARPPGRRFRGAADRRSARAARATRLGLGRASERSRGVSARRIAARWRRGRERRGACGAFAGRSARGDIARSRRDTREGGIVAGPGRGGSFEPRRTLGAAVRRATRTGARRAGRPTAAMADILDVVLEGGEASVRVLEWRARRAQSSSRRAHIPSGTLSSNEKAPFATRKLTNHPMDKTPPPSFDGSAPARSRDLRTTGDRVRFG